MSFPEEPFTLQQMAPRRRRTGLIVGLVAGAVALAVAATVGIMYFVGGRDGGAPAPSAPPIADGIARPDDSCIRTDGSDHQDYWNANGWWAGRIDGTPKEMPALSVLSLKLSGHQISSVWICAPRAGG